MIGVTAFAMAAGCGRTTPGPRAAAGPAPGQQVEATARDESGVVVTIRAERGQYRPGERLTIVAAVENRGAKPAAYRGAGPALRVAAVGPDPEVHVPLRSASPPRGYPDVEQDQFLQPGERVEERLSWDIGRDSAYPVMPGPHVFAATFPRGSVKAPPQPPLTAEITVSVGGTPPAIPRARAREIALAEPRMVEWLAAHAGPGIVRRDEAGQWWLLSDVGPDGGTVTDARGRWVRVAAELAEAIRAAELRGIPVVDHGGLGFGGGDRYRDGAWEVYRSSKLGMAPHRITIRVDAQTGRVLAVEFHDR